MPQYIINLTDFEQKLLEDDLLDVNDWFQKASTGKLSYCLKRAARRFEEIAKKENLITIPVDPIEKAKHLFAHTSYKNRVARDLLADLALQNNS